MEPAYIFSFRAIIVARGCGKFALGILRKTLRNSLQHIGLLTLPLIAVLSFLLLPHAGGQTTFGAITGTVTDPQGTAVVDAKVTIVNEQNGVPHVVTTGNTGVYFASNLDVGVYQVRVEKSGFRAYERTEVHLDASQTVNVDARLASAAPLSSAQQPTEGDLNKLNLEQLMNVPFYTASKRAQKASDTPASVTMVTAADIRAGGYRTLAEILQNVPGFWINTDRDYTFVGVRGLARPGDYNTRILLLVNGHRLNNDTDDMALLGTEFPLDVDLIERIEIARGPSSSLYGSNAFFGVVNVLTRQPSLSPKLELSVEAATQYGRKGRVTLSAPQVLDGFLLSGTLYRSDGNSSLYFPEYDTPATNFGWANGKDGDRYANGLAILRWKRFTLQGLVGSRRKVVPTASYWTVFNDPRNITTDDRGFVELDYRRDYASGMQITTRWFYDMDRLQMKGAYELEGNRFLGRMDFRSDWVGNELTLSRPLGERNILTAGAEFRYDIRQIMQAVALGFPQQLTDTNHNQSLFAAYGQDEFTLTSRISLNFGLRIDGYSTFGAAVSPRVAAIIHLDSNTTMKYIFGRAFRAPSVSEMYYADAVTTEINPSLQPETILSHNVAVEHAFKPGLTVSAEGFLNYMHGLIDTEIDLTNGLMRYVNAHSYESKGLQFDLVAQRRIWKAVLSYTLQKATDSKTGQRLANDPLHLAKLQLQAPLGSPLLVSLKMSYESPVTTYFGTRIPSLLNSSFTLSTSKPIFGLDVSGTVYNFAGRDNFGPVPPYLQQLRMPLDGREFRIKVARSFSF